MSLLEKNLFIASLIIDTGGKCARYIELNTFNVVAYEPVVAENFKKRYPAGQHGKGSISYVETPEEAPCGAHICFAFTEWKQIKEISPE